MKIIDEPALVCCQFGIGICLQNRRMEVPGFSFETC